MKIKASVKCEWSFWPLLLLFILSCEKLYNHTYTSGIYNVAVTTILLAASLCLLAFKKVKLSESDFVPLLIISLVILYGFCKESIRYGLVLFILYIWNKIRVKNIDIFVKLLVISAAIFSAGDYLLGYDRISGFTAGSPTLFSCALAICFIYFLFKLNIKTNDYFYAAACFILAFITKSSSSIIFMIAVIAYKLIINILIKFGWRSWIIKLCIAIAIILVALLLVLNLDSALGIINRGNREASTLTRIGLYKEFAKKWFADFKSFFVGYGGGFTQDYIKQYWNVTSHMPLHQDILMFLCEYGLLGSALIYIFIIKKCEFNFLMALALVLTTFHNIILSPTTLLLLVVTSNSLNEQYGKVNVLWK